MQSFSRLIIENETWLTRRVLHYLKQRKYTVYTSTLEEAWRVSIAGLSEDLLARLNQIREIPELSLDEDYSKDPFAQFGIIEARKHRSRGVNPGMFLGALKYYKQAYIDLLILAKYEPSYQEFYRLFIERFFDRIELGVLIDLTDNGDQELVNRLDAANRFITNEKNKYLTIFESNPNPTVIFDSANRVDNLNHAAAQLFQNNSTPGANYYGKKQEVDVSWLTDGITALVKSGKRKHHFEKQYIKDERIIFFEVDLIQMLDISDKFDGTIAIMRDITERKELGQEMARLDCLNLIGETAAGIGHEIRNPLTTVKGFLQLIQQKSKDSAGIEYYELMVQELDRANSIITTFISLAKNKYIELHKQSLNSLIQSILPLIEAKGFMEEKLIKFDLKDIPDLLLDEKEITQLILNIVRNGLEAMTQSGTLNIKTYKKEDTVVLSIQDEGHGIEPEVLSKIGTPFFTTKPQGTGLGLAVCYSIANRHNAIIDIKTGSKGSTFNIHFKIPN